jgi:flagellar basal body rod protein FlgG
MATATKKENAFSLEEKVTVIRQTEYGKKKGDVCREFGLVKFHDPNDLKKQGQNY